MNKQFTAVSETAIYSRQGYLFYLVSCLERMFYAFLLFLIKLSENDSDNHLEVTVLGILKFRAVGIKDFILFLCLFLILIILAFI